VSEALRDLAFGVDFSPVAALSRQFSLCGMPIATLLGLLLLASGATAQPVAVEGPAPPPTVKLDLPDPVPLDVLLDYASDRLGLNIIYDRQKVSGEVSLQSPAEIPTSLLRPLVDSVLRSRNLVLIDGQGGGWLRVVGTNELSGGARAGADADGPDGGAAPSVVSRVFVLDRLAGQQAVQLVQPFLTPGGGSAQAVDGGHGTSMLLVTDMNATVQRLSRLLEAVDAAGVPSEQRFHAVKHGNAADLSLLVIQALAAGQPIGRGDAALPVDVVVDESANRLLLIGPADRVAAAAKLAEALDADPGLKPRVYAMAHISATRFDEQLRKTLEAAPSKPVFATSAEGGQLVVTASAETHTRVAALRDLLDTPRTQVNSPIRFYRLKNANAAEVLATLRSLAPEAPAGVGAAAGLGFASGFGEGLAADAPVGLGDRAGPLPPELRTGRNAFDDADRFGRSGLNAPRDGGPDRADGRGLRDQAIRGVKTDDATITADLNTNSIIVVADPEAQSFYVNLIQQLDERRPQVMIEATLVTLDTSDNFTLGVDIVAGDRTGSRQTFALSSFGLSQLNGDVGLDLVPGVGFNGAVLDADIADIILRALKSDGRSRVVSAPKVLVNDHETGKISSQSEQPVASLSQGQNSDQLAFDQFIEAGTEIEVVPHIAEGDHLRLEFTLTLSSFGDSSGSATLPPPKQTNNISSTVTLPDGATIVVGGINRRDFSEAVSRVPILGELPLLEYLFSSRTVSESQSTLFVFLRPVILRQDQFADLKQYTLADLEAAEIAPAETGGVEFYPESEPMLLR